MRFTILLEATKAEMGKCHEELQMAGKAIAASKQISRFRELEAERKAAAK